MRLIRILNILVKINMLININLSILNDENFKYRLVLRYCQIPLLFFSYQYKKII